MKANKTLITVGVIALFLLLIVGWFYRSYNKMVTKDEECSKQWAQVENVYQRRADLIPNLVSTVKGYAAHEQETFTAVIEARNQATQIHVNQGETPNPETIKAFQDAQNQVGSALSRLLVTVERYPDLKANQNFLDLQTQLESTENRIATERKRFNDVIMNYNAYIRRFPANIVAGMFDFEKKAYFEARQGADVAPVVEF